MKGEAVAIAASRERTGRARAADFVALAKPRLNTLVVATTMAGFYLGAGENIDFVKLVNTVIGTALVAGGAAAFNQVEERDLDALMQRTRTRPLPDGRLQPAEASCFAAALAMAGLLQLAVGTGALASLVALATVSTYALIYTPLKRRTSFATVVGAVPGALPPVIGWAAARGELGGGALALFGIVFLWQLPHFLAIAWMYREDYARARLPLLPVIDPDGGSTARQVVLYAAALVPVSLAPAALGLAGQAYLTGAVLLGAGFLLLALRFAIARSTSTARQLFFGSITYLPLLWALMIANRQ
ncbi:MAG: protoheme IX farnesyltransferase [Acidobacteria bacterium]|nr:protoheme IX farnesyltransferase [Acidobacteriota bacterium]